MAALTGIGCESEKTIPPEEVLNHDREATYRGPCRTECEQFCFVHEYCCCEIEVAFQGDLDSIQLCKDWDYDPMSRDTCGLIGCGQHGQVGEIQSLTLGENIVCLIRNMDFHFWNETTSDTLYVKIACGEGCADEAPYTIAPGELYKFGLDSACDHFYCN